MNVSLTPELEEWIRKQVESGRYASASEVVREALRLMDANQRRLRLERSFDDALEQHQRDGGTPLSEVTVERIMADADEADRLGLPIDDDVTW